ncbi:hypothetical protein BKA64DRAFT_653228 [Cadophora sp. MPI-SDFR-AT-0126]|nr:hypothetical protein BKA64DRAFT_653228 [Leotiomycetes sp. MPI-SDFR-AT-0126]
MEAIEGSMELPFVTLAANGMQAESSSSSNESMSRSRPSSAPSSRTHDTSLTLYHMDELDDFTRILQKAVNSVFPNAGRSQTRYKDVQVVLIRWADDNHLGVWCEMEDLCRTFEHGYGFKTTTWLIPTENPLLEIMTKSIALVNEIGSEDNLVILYYGGHAAMNDARQQIWLRTGNWNRGSLEWFAIQPIFLNARADVLFLLDCCSAASATTSSSSAVGIKETIAACGFEAQAPEPGGHSFTNVLIEVLEEWKHRHVFSAAMLHNELLARLRHHKPKKDMYGKVVESRRSPVYVVTTSNAKAVSIEFARRAPKEPSGKGKEPSHHEAETSPKPGATASGVSRDLADIASLSLSEEDSEGVPLEAPSCPEQFSESQLNKISPDGELAIPHVLISLALEGDQLLDTRPWTRWISEFPALAKYATIEGIYKSHSTLLILSVPVFIWNFIPEHLACSFIGYVESMNYLREVTWEDNVELQTWLETKRNTLEAEAASGVDEIQQSLQIQSQGLPAGRSISQVATWNSDDKVHKGNMAAPGSSVPWNEPLMAKNLAPAIRIPSPPASHGRAGEESTLHAPAIDVSFAPSSSKGLRTATGYENDVFLAPKPIKRNRLKPTLGQNHPATFQCTLCPKRFTRAYNLRSHLRTHTDERPFICTVCGKAFARQHDRRRHEGLHSGEKKFVCKGELKEGEQWGCGRRFARADALARHFRSEAGSVCIQPLCREEAQEGLRDKGAFPSALLAQYPALANLAWSESPQAGADGGYEDGFNSNRSSFSSFGSCASEAVSEFHGGYEDDIMQSPRLGF